MTSCNAFFINQSYLTKSIHINVVFQEKKIYPQKSKSVSKTENQDAAYRTHLANYCSKIVNSFLSWENLGKPSQRSETNSREKVETYCRFL